LGCPPPSMTDTEYARLVQKLKVNAVQLYGCNRHDQGGLSRLFAQILKQGSGPVLLTNISGTSPQWDSYHFPRMVVGGTTDRDPNITAAGLTRHLADVTLASGAIITIVNSHREGGNVALTLAITKEPGSQPRSLRFYSENGLLAEKPLDFSNNNDKVVATHRLKLPPRDRWLRVEVVGVGSAMGRSGLAGEKDVYKPLAASNFMQLDTLDRAAPKD